MHQEAGVEGQRPPAGADDVVSVRVPAQSVVGLVEGHVVGPLEQVGRSQAGHSGAYHRRPRPVRPPSGAGRRPVPPDRHVEPATVEVFAARN